jgi:hypothetical protein
MDMSKTPAQLRPFVEPAPPSGSPPAGSSLSESKAQPLNARGPSSGLPPPPEPFREPTAQHLSGSLSVPSGQPTEVAHRMGLEHPAEAPAPTGLRGSVFDRPSELTTAASHQQLRDHARALLPR